MRGRCPRLVNLTPGGVTHASPQGTNLTAGGNATGKRQLQNASDVSKRPPFNIRCNEGSRFLVEKITCTISETRVWAMGVPFFVRPSQGWEWVGGFYPVGIAHGCSISRLRRERGKFFRTSCRIPVRPFDYIVKAETRGWKKKAAGRRQEADRKARKPAENT
jgi:hypothetical protein